MASPRAGGRSGTTVWAALVLAIVVGGCKDPRAVPPTFSVFSLTDKFFDVDALGEGKFVALGYGSKIFHSDDAGAVWRLTGSVKGRSLTRLTFVDGSLGWAVGHAGKVLRTDDGGVTWSPQESGSESALFDVHALDENRAWSVGDVSTLISTTNGGETWKAEKIDLSMIGVRPDMSLAIEDPIFYSVFFVDENVGWITGEYGQIRFTKDGGKTWGAQHEDLMVGRIRDVMGLPTLFCIRFRDHDNGVTVGTDGAIYVTSDGGETWTASESPVKEPLYVVHFLPDGDSVIVGSSGILLRGNAEDGWKPSELPVGIYSWLSSVDFDSSGNGIAAGGHGLILTSADMGKAWAQTLWQ